MATLPRLVVTKTTHPQLWLCYQTHPEIVHVFENICIGSALGSNVGHTGYPLAMFDLYLKELFLPVLLQSEAIVEDSKVPFGYRPLVECLEFQGWESRKDVAEHTKHYANNICSSISESDSAENTVLSALSGRYHPADAHAFLNDLKGLLRRHISRAQTEESGGVTMRLAILGKIGRSATVLIFAVGVSLGFAGRGFAGGNGYVEKIPAGKKTNIEANGAELFVVNSSSQITESELRALANFKSHMSSLFGSKGAKVSYSIDVNRGAVSYIDPNSGQQVTLEFSDLGN
jgi:hypothetical protein